MSAAAVLVRGSEALRRQFPHVDAEAVALFADACGGRPDGETVAALADMQREALAGAGVGIGQIPTRGCQVLAPVASIAANDELELRLEGGDAHAHAGTVLLISGINDFQHCTEDDTPVAAMALPGGQVLALESQQPPTCFWAQDYGMHELRVFRPNEEEARCCRFMVTSPVGDFAEALDHFNDAYDWAWDGGWTEELEEGCVLLLSALEDHFQALEQGPASVAGLGAAALSAVKQPRKRLEKHLAKVLEDHDVLALGRATASIRSLVRAHGLLDIFSNLLGGGSKQPLAESAFYESVLVFERARFGATSPAKRIELRTALGRLVAAADAQCACIHASGGQDFASRWHGQLRAQLVDMLDNEAVMHPLPFHQLRGGGGGYMAEMMASVVDAMGSSSSSVRRADTTEAMCSLGPQLSFEGADARVTRWLESLVDESIQVGTPIAPFELPARPPAPAAVLAAIQSLLSLGLGYVSQGDTEDARSSNLVALLDRVRAALPLQRPSSQRRFLSERRRRDRLKDVCRVLRAARRKGQRLSLAVNTDFTGALRALREHHSDSWLGPCLESAWTEMLSSRQVFCFELWLHEAPAASPSETSAPPRLVAADFGHPHTRGLAYYVATRFFDRELRTLQPGFILAFAEAECLRRAGVELWDLGGADASPMMAYKPQVALELNRSEFLRRLRELAASIGTLDEDPSARRRRPLCDPEAPLPAGGERLPTGVVFEDLTEDDLWGSTLLRDLEGGVRAAAKAAATSKPKKERPARKAGAKPTAAAAPAPAVPAPGPSPEGPSGHTGGRDAAKLRFLSFFQQFVAEGLPENEAAARALKAAAAA